MKMKSLLKFLSAVLSFPVILSSCIPANQQTNMSGSKPARENEILEYKNSVYYLNNADGFSLYCDNDGIKKNLIDENIFNYYMWNDLIFYSTSSGLFLTDPRKKNTVRLLDKKSGMDSYHSFQKYKDAIFFSYFDRSKKQNVYYVYDLKNKKLNEIGISNIVYDAPLQSEWNDFGIVHYEPGGIIHVFPDGIVKEKTNGSNQYVFRVAENERILTHSYYNGLIYILISNKTDRTYRYSGIDRSGKAVLQSKEVDLFGGFVFLNGRLYCYSNQKISKINADGTIEDIITDLDHFISPRHSMRKMYAGAENIYLYTTHRYNTESYSIWKISPEHKSCSPIINAANDEMDARFDGAKGGSGF